MSEKDLQALAIFGNFKVIQQAKHIAYNAVSRSRSRISQFGSLVYTISVIRVIAADESDDLKVCALVVSNYVTETCERNRLKRNFGAT